MHDRFFNCYHQWRQQDPNCVHLNVFMKLQLKLQSAIFTFVMVYCRWLEPFTVLITGTNSFLCCHSQKTNTKRFHQQFCIFRDSENSFYCFYNGNILRTVLNSLCNYLLCFDIDTILISVIQYDGNGYHEQRMWFNFFWTL